jgi:enamidase
MFRHMTSLYVISLVSAVVLAAQPPQRPDAVRQFVSVDTPLVALTHARVIDGTGGPARANQTLVIDSVAGKVGLW